MMHVETAECAPVHESKWLGLWVKLNTLPKRHPLRSSIRSAHRSIKLRSSLGRLADRFANIDVSKLETVTPFARSPWTPGPDVIIEDRETASRATEAQHPREVHCYTDGSCRAGVLGIGIVYVLPDDERTKIEEHATTGSVVNCNVYATELEAIQIASAQLAGTGGPTLRSVTIFSDNQSALNSIRKPRQQSGQCIIKKILSNVEQLHQRDIAVTLRWVPAHSGIAGNERADRLAKRSTASGATIPPEIRLRSAAIRCARQSRQHIRQKIKEGRFSRSIDAAIPGRHTKIIYDSLSKAESQIFVQLRTEHCRLDKYLHRIGVVASPLCDECGVEENVQHFLMDCRRWLEPRRLLIQTTRPRNDLSFLLGGRSARVNRRGDMIDGPKWKPDMTAVHATINFVRSTERFDYEMR